MDKTLIIIDKESNKAVEIEISEKMVEGIAAPEKKLLDDNRYMLALVMEDALRRIYYGTI